MEEEYAKKIEKNLGGVLSRIRTASGGGEVELMLATKTVPAEVINYVNESFGLSLIGENKVQELLEKYPYLDRGKFRIHIIGHLQTNKVRQIIDKVDMIQSLDRYELALEISKRAMAKGIKMPVLIEINIGREEQKGGVYPEKAVEFIKEISSLEGIDIQGLMTMAPAKISSEEYKEYFTKTRELFDEIASLDISGVTMKTLSMGMSDSFEEAAQCGATMVRVGSAVFGKREYPENNKEGRMG